LRRHISSRHGLSRDEYLRRWGLQSDHPLTAPAYSERRSTLAKQLGLGRKPKTDEAPAPTPAETDSEHVDGDVDATSKPRRTTRSRLKSDVVNEGAPEPTKESGAATPKPAKSVPTELLSLRSNFRQARYVPEAFGERIEEYPEVSASALAGSSHKPRGRSSPRRSIPALRRTSIRAFRIGRLDGHSAERYPATHVADLAGRISLRHLEANAPPVGNASHIAETDNPDRR
jgi:hypothetical protein